MKRALVVVDDTDRHRDLLREAGELAAGVDAELVVLTLLTEMELEENVETMQRIADVEHTSYGNREAIEAAARFGSELTEEVLGDVDVTVESIGKVVEDDEQAAGIVSAADDHECDHVFIAGRRRRPTGKAIFGDVAQSVILNYEGPVTVITG